jgi:cytochrome P450
MIPEMYKNNIRLGLSPGEAAKMEMATSLAMLSSGANTTFWLLYHIFSNQEALEAIRNELSMLATTNTEDSVLGGRTVDLSRIKSECPTTVAMLNETLRFHGSVINIKQVQHDTTSVGDYLLKKDAIVMIPGQSVHRDKGIWGAEADVFDHRRFFLPEAKKKLSSTSAFRPFGAGVTMCPGRHFSTNVMLGFVAMVVLQYEIVPEVGQWIAPSKRNADFWNAMPKPDMDINVRFIKKVHEKDVGWKFIWGCGA